MVFVVIVILVGICFISTKQTDPTLVWIAEKTLRRKLEKLAKFFCLKIGRNENFIIQMSYGDKKLFNNFFLFVIENFDFQVEMPPEREVL